jgi:hypothetical protein
MSQYNPVKGLVGSWLTPDWYQEGGALGYKVVGRAHIHDSIIINTINLLSCLCALPVQIDSMLQSNIMQPVFRPSSLLHTMTRQRFWRPGTRLVPKAQQSLAISLQMVLLINFRIKDSIAKEELLTVRLAITLLPTCQPTIDVQIPPIRIIAYICLKEMII